MFPFSRLTAVAVLPVALAAGVAATTGTVVAPAHAASDGVRCEITVSKRGGITTLEGVVLASKSVSGSYRLSVTTSGGSGGSDIDQSGAFSASAGQSSSLGVVSLGGTANLASAQLSVKWNGGSTQCSQRIGGRG